MLLVDLSKVVILHVDMVQVCIVPASKYMKM